MSCEVRSAMGEDAEEHESLRASLRKERARRRVAVRCDWLKGTRGDRMET